MVIVDRINDWREYVQGGKTTVVNMYGWKNDWREYVRVVKNDGREYVREGIFRIPRRQNTILEGGCLNRLDGILPADIPLVLPAVTLVLGAGAVFGWRATGTYPGA